MAKVLRILTAALLLVVAAAGCGGAARPQKDAVPRVPRALAQNWEGRASAIADAASAGNSCQARQLANSLRTDVEASKNEVPLRLRAPLLTSVNALADRITCPPVTPTTTEKPKPPPKPDHKEHGKGHGKGHGHDKGDEG